MAVYLITGASSGIGEQIARQAVGRGNKVYAVARRIELLEKMQADLGDQLVPVTCDVTDKEMVKKVCDELPDLPDVVILNAGQGDFDNRQAFEVDVHEKLFKINYFGALYWIEILFPRFAERGSGKFVATSSLAAFRGMPDAAAYCASKAALSSAIESMRLTYKKQGIDFSLIHPGFVKTKMTASNKNPMPFLWSSEKAANYILNGIEKGKLNINFPLPMRFMITLVQLLPASWYKKLSP